MALFTSRSATIRLLDPITSTALITLTTQLRNLDTGESLDYAERGYHRSGSVSSARLRSKGSLAIDKTPDGMALARVLKQWQQGVIYFPLTSDLKGRTYRHPNLEISMTDAGTTEVITAYGVRLASRSFGLPLSGPASDSIALDVLRGFDLSSTEAADNYEPRRALDFARTGSKTYVNTAGTFMGGAPGSANPAATDGMAAFGLPYVVRRNLVPDSESFETSSWVKQSGVSVAANQAGRPDLPNLTDHATDANADRIDWAGAAINTGILLNTAVSVSTTAACIQSVYVRADVAGGTVGLASGTGAIVGETIITLTTSWQRLSLSEVRSAGLAAHWLRKKADSPLSIYVYGAQIDNGSITPYQATNATGVDLTNSLNGEGLVLEGAGTNLCLNSEDFGAGSWTTANVTVTVNAVTAPDGSTPMSADAIYETTANAAHSIYQGAVVAAGPVTQSVFIKPNGRTWAVIDDGGGAAAAFYNLTGGGSLGTVASGVTATISDAGSGWYLCVYTKTQPAATVNHQIRPSTGDGVLTYVGDPAKGFYVWGAQMEQNPFRTSYIKTTSATATRQPDLCGIVPLQNELTYSHDLTQAAWIKTGLTAAKSGSDNTLTLAATTDHIYQAVTLSSVPSTTRTAAARLKLGTLSGIVLLRLLDQSGNVIASTTIATTSLSASEYRTFYVTGTAASDDTGLRVQLIGNSGTGTILVRSLGLVQGNHPGVEVQTGDTAIPAPASPALDPAWQQNGTLTGYFVQPSGANVAAGTVILGYVGGLLITQLASTITLSRVTAGGTRTVTITLNAADGARHSFSASCGNYVTSAGVRAMPLTLTVDSTTATIDAAALYGDTAWSDLDASRLVSGGTVNATLSSVRPDWPTIPAGAIPA